MPIQHYLKEIGRGKDGARALSRAQSADLMGQLLDGQVDALATGAFCVAMRIKGETPEEMAGFLDAIHQRLPLLPLQPQPWVVLPSYNGARKLPVLTPLLALLLAREGLPVLLHGCTTEASRTTSAQVLQALGHAPTTALSNIAPGQLQHCSAEALHPGLQRLLNARAAIGLRNPAHSLVKLLNPLGRNAQPALVVGSYTHPEYATSMAATQALVRATALLLRGTEGEPVADPRRHPAMTAVLHGQPQVLQDSQRGTLADLPPLPNGHDVQATARYTEDVLTGLLPVPAPIAQQLHYLKQLHAQLPQPQQTISAPKSL
ncbi:MAG: DNA-binding protein YbiB [Acidovorax sp.]|jgi:anthranilate phosphoribosyltransferase|nr:DNA-binding protein YbiB [Acidovorax sp.]